MAIQTKNTGYSIIFPKLERKQRIFILKGNKAPIRHMINVKHTSSKPLTYFDGQLNRALRWATNQISPFVDEQDGIATIEPITFKDGKLIVEDWNLNLQKFLLIHPEFNKRYYEFDPEKNAQDDVETMVSSLDAQVAAKDMNINDLEAIARVVLKNKNLISRMTSSELRRDMIIWARNNSQEFMDLLNDENLKLRNIAVSDGEENDLHVEADNRTVVWGDNKKEKVIVVPYGENVYSALAVYFKTDEGLDVLQNITNKL